MVLRVILSAENSQKNSEHVTKRNCGECKKRHSEGFATKGDFSNAVSLKGRLHKEILSAQGSYRILTKRSLKR